MSFSSTSPRLLLSRLIQNKTDQMSCSENIPFSQPHRVLRFQKRSHISLGPPSGSWSPLTQRSEIPWPGTVGMGFWDLFLLGKQPRTECVCHGEQIFTRRIKVIQLVIVVIVHLRSKYSPAEILFLSDCCTVHGYLYTYALFDKEEQNKGIQSEA